ncbi:unnamed protein product [Boreogadus saida]
MIQLLSQIPVGRSVLAPAAALTTGPGGSPTTKAEKKRPRVKDEASRDAPTSAEPQSCEIAVSSVSKPCTPIASPMSLTHPEQEIGLNMKCGPCGGEGFKYKVSLENRGRVLVSGHHLACEDTAPLCSLHVGVRVVTSYRKDNKPFFYSGILGELPSRRNRMSGGPLGRTSQETPTGDSSGST